MNRILAALIGVVLLACGPLPAFAQNIAIPGVIVPVTGVGYGTVGAAAQAVDTTHPLPVTLAPAGGPATCTVVAVASSASAVTELAANAARKGAMIVNDSTAILYLILSTTAPTSALYTVALDAKGTVGAYYEVPAGFTGIIKGIWASANGSALVTECT